MVKPRKYFTLEDANRALPLIRAIVTDVVACLRNVDELRQRLAEIHVRNRARVKAPAYTKLTKIKNQKSPMDCYAEEVGQTEAELTAEIARLQPFINELQQLGVEFKGAEGLCDFPSLRDGREVYLCWKLGESEVSHWHEIHEGFSGRRRLKSEIASSMIN